jgi:hypothetical protein
MELTIQFSRTAVTNIDCDTLDARSGFPQAGNGGQKSNSVEVIGEGMFRLTG